MIKIVSNEEEGYTLFFEKNKDEIECLAFETNIHMSGQEVADELDITRSTVSQSLKRSVRKIYYRMKKIYDQSSPIEILILMATIFNINTEAQYKKFFNLFPSNIKGEVHAEAFRTGLCKN